MITYEQALRDILREARPLEVKRCALENALGRVSAENIASDIDVPAFDRSAMDGFALRSADGMNAPVDLQIVEEIPAGYLSKRSIGLNEAARIMTGAPVPRGADAVQQLEKTASVEGQPDRVKIVEPVTPRQNVCQRGEDIRSGEIVLPRGRPIGIAEIGVLGMLGMTTLRVHRAPQVAILATGDEIVPIEEVPTAGQIRNSNSHMLAVASRMLGAVATQLSIAPDRKAALRRLINEGLASDILLIIGGASVGEHDLVASALDEEGVVLSIDGVAMKPGKPMLFGSKDHTLIFGLPGNPVSALVCFWLFAVPALRSLMGYESANHRPITASLSRKVEKKRQKAYFLPGKLAGSPVPKVTPLKTHGSGDLRHFSLADGLIYLHHDWGEVAADCLVEVILLDGFPTRDSWTAIRGGVVSEGAYRQLG